MDMTLAIGGFCFGTKQESDSMCFLLMIHDCGDGRAEGILEGRGHGIRLRNFVEN